MLTGCQCVVLSFRRQRVMTPAPTPKNKPMNIHLSIKSTNPKTGPIPVSTSPASTCPPVCPFRGSGCYADSGPMRFHWNSVSRGERGDAWRAFLERLMDLPPGQLWRHNQAGDLPGIGNRIDARALDELAKASAGKRGFTYTHKPVISTPSVPASVVSSNLKSVRNAVDAGFVVNLSGNSISHADELAKTGLPVATVVPPESPDRFVTPSGNRVVICPAQRVNGLNCDKCRLCSKSDRGVIIGFKPHGAGHKKVSKVACSTN